MLESLHIKNFRILKDLSINSLGRVNLITGKNNSGKSSLLEAITIFVTKGDLKYLIESIESRGESFIFDKNIRNFKEINTKAFATLFPNRVFDVKNIETLTIESSEKDDSSNKKHQKNLLAIKFDSFRNYRDKKKNTSVQSFGEYDFISDLGLRIAYNEGELFFSLSSHLAYNLETINNFQSISSINIDREINSILWDKIYLTDKEDYVVDALKIINPKAEKIGFVGDVSGKRKAILKSSDYLNPLPLKSMGDGINRILTIILALVNAENGYLLIDEFENGLHHSAQEQLWEIIFHLAEKLNVQVFATTHSDDCIGGFEKSLNKPENKVSGELIRLYNKNGFIKQIQYTAEDLKISVDQQIEIRG